MVAGIPPAIAPVRGSTGRASEREVLHAKLRVEPEKKRRAALTPQHDPDEDSPPLPPGSIIDILV